MLIVIISIRKNFNEWRNTTHDQGWTGIKLDSAIQITKIRYAPRNYDNYIKKGDDYELFASCKAGWRSLGRKKAGADSLFYKSVPINGLFYLKNYSSGQNERIFTLEEDKMVFR